jgi:hypothetical protein
MATANASVWFRIVDYWRSRHVDGRPPSRNDIDPVVDIPDLAKNLMLLDIVPEGYRYRIVGTALRERLGFELTGRMLADGAASSTIQATWKSAADSVCADLEPRLVISRLAPVLGARQLAIIMPLVDGSGRIENLLIASFHEGEFGSELKVTDVSVEVLSIEEWDSKAQAPRPPI